MLGTGSAAESATRIERVPLTTLREAREPMIYVPVSDFYVPSTSLLVRTEGSPRALLPAVKRGGESARSHRSHVPDADAERACWAGHGPGEGDSVALVGIRRAGACARGDRLYGVIGYTTQIRGREVGGRLALGASPRALLLLVLGQGAGLAAAGITLGLIITAGSTRVVQSMLFGVSPTDGVTFAVIAVVLLLVALAASAAPAWRASRVDPIRALRAE